MRHQRKRNTLGRAKDQTKALLRSLSAELLMRGEIVTTLSKAKVLRPFVEKVITKARYAIKETDIAKQLHYKRQIISTVFPRILNIAMTRSEKLIDREGGYTRIVKLGNRRGDNTQMALIQILDQDEQ